MTRRLLNAALGFALGVITAPLALVAWGIHGKARGVEGAHIVLADWRMNENYDWHLHGAKMVRIDGKKYKADPWYALRDGKVVEVAE